MVRIFRTLQLQQYLNNIFRRSIILSYLCNDLMQILTFQNNSISIQIFRTDKLPVFRSIVGATWTKPDFTRWSTDLIAFT